MAASAERLTSEPDLFGERPEPPVATPSDGRSGNLYVPAEAEIESERGFVLPFDVELGTAEASIACHSFRSLHHATANASPAQGVEGSNRPKEDSGVPALEIEPDLRDRKISRSGEKHHAAASFLRLESFTDDIAIRREEAHPLQCRKIIFHAGADRGGDGRLYSAERLPAFHTARLGHADPPVNL
jgi:hypothetical protein